MKPLISLAAPRAGEFAEAVFPRPGATRPHIVAGTLKSNGAHARIAGVAALGLVLAVSGPAFVPDVKRGAISEFGPRSLIYHKAAPIASTRPSYAPPHLKDPLWYRQSSAAIMPISNSCGQINANVAASAQVSGDDATWMLPMGSPLQLPCHWRDRPSSANSQSYQQRLVQNARRAPSHLI